ncbi:MAG: hybrid sensor histidine kinase/response regulator [Deltaproteobacteria bacterium]|nr:hybrid sensor histidine kinase/response regulator [Deltaproteobacteria bacterium]MBI3293634.1 hybrid sensor histidine kinase/response regulator [Deltaproteobacteria bacterium]
MSVGQKTLCVVTRIPQKAVRALLDSLKDWTVTTVALNSISDLSPLAGASAILIQSGDSDWTADLARAIRATPDTALSTSAILWVRKKGSPWTEPAIDDVIVPVEEGALDRLRMRLHQAEERRFTASRALENAKAETILKQREEFLGVCAHDLRSPIGLIRASLKMALGDKGALSELQRELMVRAERQASHALTLVDDLLDVMSYEQGLQPDYQLVALGTFFEDFYKDYKLQAEQKNICLEYDNQVPTWAALIDPDRVRQMLQNIFTNAVKFTQAGKKIFLRVEPFQGRRKNDPPYPMVLVTLRDEGKGIPEKEIAGIFNRFSQIRGAGRGDGRGLGLTVAKQIAQLHDGNIWVSSREGEGSSFFALFPHVVSAPPGATHKGRVLIVDPAPENRELYRHSFSQQFSEVLFARDGVEAITLTHFHKPEAILFSPKVEKISSTDAARILKASHSGMRRFLLTLDPEKPPFDASLFDGVVQLPLFDQI